jgi:PAS domain S-box-containing protein
MKDDAESDRRDRAQEALNGSSQRLRIALDSGRVGIWEWDIPTGRISCSPGLELIHYRVPGTFAGTYEALLNQVHPSDREHFAAAVERALEQKSDYCVEYRVVLPDNTTGWVESRGRVDCDGQGRAERMISVCADITERRQTLDSLGQSDERYRSIVDAANEGVWLIDTQARTLYVNWRLSFMLGYTADEFIGRRLPQFCFPNDIEAAQDHIESSFQGVSRQFDFRFRHKNGSEVLVFASTSPTRVAQGSIIGTLGLFWDVTARKQAERALRESEERFRQLTENLEDVFWVADPVTEKVIYVSPAYDRLWGRSAESLYRNHLEWTEAIHPDDRERVRGSFGLNAVQGQFEEEYRILRPDGSLRWIHDRRFPVRNESGDIDRLVGFAEDITERKNAEIGLRLSAGKLRALLESASEGIVAIDGEGKILLVNAKSEELFGYRREELVGQTVETLLPDDLRSVHSGHRQEYFAYFAHPRTRAMGFGMTLAARRKDGTTFPVEISLSFVHEDESVVVLALITDITKRKRFEEQLRETAKLESLGVLAGGVAHDFNNLLTGVLGNASMAMEQLPAGSPIRALIEDVVRSSERAALLTKQMLAYSGRGTFVVQPVNLSDFTRDIVTLLQSSVPRTVQLQLQLPAEVTPVEADIAQLQQVVMNLVINGAEAIGDAPGVLTIRTGVREFSPGQIRASLSASGIVPGRYAFLEVQDTGCGMDEATKQRIFDPFFTTKFIGRGLGLAAVQGIVRGHRGAIDVDSTPGRGSIFTVLLPVTLGQIRTPDSIEQRAGRVGAGTILVVDDEEMIRKLARSILEQSGYTVIVAENGEQAIRIFREVVGQISAVLLDMTMPVMSGEKTLQQLRDINPDVPVLLSSGFSEIEARERFPGKAVQGFVQKPYTAPHLVEKISSVATASRSPSANAGR